MLHKVLFIFVFLAIGLPSIGQTIDGYNYSYYNFSKTDGIPEVNVFSIVQDHQNFIYTGAGSGLYVHYGHKWQHLPSPIDNEDNNIGSYLHELVFNPANKMLYLGSYTDVQCYNTQSGLFDRIKTHPGFHDVQKYTFFYHKYTGVLVPTAEGIFQVANDTLIPFKPSTIWPQKVSKTCRSFETIDNDKIVVFCKEQIGIYHLSYDSLVLYPHPIGVFIRKGVYDHSRNKIWFQSYQKIYFFDLNTMKYGVQPGSENTYEIRNIVLKDNQLWISSGVYFDLMKNRWEVIPYAEGKYSNAIMYWPRFLLDKENSLWTSSQGYNLNVLFDKNKFVRNLDLIFNGFSMEPAASLMANGKLYVANNILYEYEASTHTSKYYTIAENQFSYNLCYDNDHTIYISSQQNVYAFDTNTKNVKKINIPYENLSKIGEIDDLVYGDNKLIVVGDKGLMTMSPDGMNAEFTHIDQLDNGNNLSTYFDKVDKLFYIVYAKNILIYNDRTNVISKLQTDINNFRIKNRVQLIRKGDHLYISSSTDGLYQYNLHTKNLTLFNKSNSLLETNYTSFLAEDGANIWVASMQGIYLFDTKNECFTTKLDRQIGFKHDHATYGMVADKDYVVQLTFGQFGILNKKALAKTGQIPLYLNSINIENHERLPVPLCRDTTLNLSENESIIDISYGLPYFTNYNYNHFQYRILGHDTTWNATFSTTLRLPKLDIGNYTLEIRAWKSNGEKVEGIRKISFSIKPLFYKTWWFLTVVLSLLSLLIYVLYKLKLDKVKSELTLRNKYEKQISDLEMKALRAQMNPHFVFNSLNSIENFILKNDRVMASEYLGKFSKLIRNILDHSRTEVIPLTKEMETLKLYIDLEAIRTNNSFKVVYEIDHDLLDDNINIPPMLMQPHVENAIIHGLKYLENKTGILKVTLKNIHDEYIEYSIEDNGIGRQKSIEIKSANAFNHKSYGMDITQNRVNLHNQRYKTTITFTIDDVICDGEIGGTIVKFFIPFQ